MRWRGYLALPLSPSVYLVAVAALPALPQSFGIIASNAAQEVVKPLGALGGVVSIGGLLLLLGCYTRRNLGLKLGRF